MSDIISGVGVQFEWVRTEDQWAQLKAFAESFGHKVLKNRHPVVVVKFHERWVGYAQIYRGPVVFTAWHTDKNVCSPRQVVEGFKAFAGWAKIEHGGAFTGVPMDTKTFLPNIMQKLGFSRCNTELYEILSDK